MAKSALLRHTRAADDGRTAGLVRTVSSVDDL